ncbi:hypothetical protein CANCADRAFT_31966 [Tortispora caseinolytica NRRL Y-17796]|uniref:Lysophospholipase n=1 Tax=Tortispora caseinolytica NRRL Y-17796 TaxID=767744 RepID=A0A1E4THQ4_9ASCO|nr:hypothetical protein CANCADRAFT_31966 [Tortispora caseinolytica NRRL Y-17796]
MRVLLVALFCCLLQSVESLSEFRDLLLKELDEIGVNITLVQSNASIEEVKMQYLEDRKKNLIERADDTPLHEKQHEVLRFIDDALKLAKQPEEGIPDLEYKSDVGLNSHYMQGFEPVEQKCTIDQIGRTGSAVGPVERHYINGRAPTLKMNMRSFLEQTPEIDIDTEKFLELHVPKIALAFSGGGYRALLCGAGTLMAADSRTDGTEGPYQIGGLLQASTYVSGLSGGSWLLGSIYMNGFSKVTDLVKDEFVWNFEKTMLLPEKSLFRSLKHIASIYKLILKKHKAGYTVTFTDFWGSLLAHQLLYNKGVGPQSTLSSLQNADCFQSYYAPVPFIVAADRGSLFSPMSEDSVLYSFSPFELGSWDPSLQSYIQTELIGTDTRRYHELQKCTYGFDNMGFIIGTSSSLLNVVTQALETVLKSVPVLYTRVLALILNELRSHTNGFDTAVFKPNPFTGTRTRIRRASLFEEDAIHMVDGGLTGQNIPLHPLLPKEREVDVIFAFDNSADTFHNWPNGISLVETMRQLNKDPSTANRFPNIPDKAALKDPHFRVKPTIFGCDAGSDELDIPLIVYMPNTKWSHKSNFATTKMEYKVEESSGVIQNAYNIATQGNSSAGVTDPEQAKWGTCVRCIAILRGMQRNDLAISDECYKCAQTYCWKPLVGIKRQTSSLLPSSAILTTAESMNSTSTIHFKATKVPDSNAITSSKIDAKNSTFVWSSVNTGSSSGVSVESANVSVSQNTSSAVQRPLRGFFKINNIETTKTNSSFYIEPSSFESQIVYAKSFSGILQPAATSTNSVYSSSSVLSSIPRNWSYSTLESSAKIKALSKEHTLLMHNSSQSFEPKSMLYDSFNLNSSILATASPIQQPTRETAVVFEIRVAENMLLNTKQRPGNSSINVTVTYNVSASSEAHSDEPLSTFDIDAYIAGLVGSCF